jgi:hypothetical protein
VDFIGDMQDTPSHRVNRDNLRTRYNFSVNPYWYNEHYTGTSKDLLDEVMTAMKGADWYDRSDIQTDYFDTAYYYDVNVGSWQKPYTLTK